MSFSTYFYTFQSVNFAGRCCEESVFPWVCHTRCPCVLLLRWACLHSVLCSSCSVEQSCCWAARRLPPVVGGFQAGSSILFTASVLCLFTAARCGGCRPDHVCRGWHCEAFATPSRDGGAGSWRNVKSSGLYSGGKRWETVDPADFERQLRRAQVHVVQVSRDAATNRASVEEFEHALQEILADAVAIVVSIAT